MDKWFFDYTLENQDNYVKKTCFIVREYLRNCEFGCEGHNIFPFDDDCAITAKEFLKATKMLLATTWHDIDNITPPETWYCENDCDRNNGLDGFCQGEFQSDAESKQLCKYYLDSFNK